MKTLKLVTSPILLSAITFLIYYQFAIVGLDPHHDGIMLKPALDVLDGQTLFRDTFNQYGALVTYIQSFFLWLFEPSLRSLRVSTVFAYSFSIFILSVCWRNIVDEVLLLVSFFLFILFAPFYDWIFLPWSSVFAVAFQGLTLWAFIRMVNGNQPAFFGALCGVTSVFAFLCRQPVGVCLTLGILSVVIFMGIFSQYRKKGIRSLLGFVFGGGFIVLLFLLHLKWTGSFHDWFFQSVIWPNQWTAAKFGQNRGVIVSILLSNYESGLVCLAFLVAALFPFYLSRRVKLPRLKMTATIYYSLLLLIFIYLAKKNSDIFWFPGGLSFAFPALFATFTFHRGLKMLLRRTKIETKDWILLYLGVLGLSSWSQYYPIPCARHTYWAMIPVIGFFVYICSKIAGGQSKAVALILLLLVSPMVVGKTRQAYTKLSQPLVDVDHIPLMKGMRISPGDAAAVKKFVQVLETFNQRKPGIQFITEGRDAFWSALAPNKTNFSPIYIYWKEMDLKYDDIQLRTQYLKEKRPVFYVQRVGYSRDYPSELAKKVNYKKICSFSEGEFWVPAELELPTDSEFFKGS